MTNSDSKSKTWSHYDETLKAVSRSFYLSIKFLPSAMREPIALGYLLARLTDTFADSDTLAISHRIELLESTRDILTNHSTQNQIPIKLVASKLSHSGEQQLVLRSPEIFQWYIDSTQQDRELISEVLSNIITGQRWDLEFFHQQSTKAEASEQQLLTYIYQVAGSVGEFWTKVGYAKLGNKYAATEDRDQLLTNGRALGEGLQLINIIRDLHEDLPAGRHYIPNQEYQTWLRECRLRLDQGRNYVKKLNNRRASFTSGLPLLLAESTADKIEAIGIEHVLNEKVKISRPTVLKKAVEAALYL